MHPTRIQRTLRSVEVEFCDHARSHHAAAGKSHLGTLGACARAGRPGGTGRRPRGETAARRRLGVSFSGSCGVGSRGICQLDPGVRRWPSATMRPAAARFPGGPGLICARERVAALLYSSSDTLFSPQQLGRFSIRAVVIV
jgi:hypothetical protein